MVSIDHTYDEFIHNDYQNKRLHTAIQKSRKDMGLRPWNSITVILDDRYATEQIRLNLQNNLTNSVVIIGHIIDDVLYDSLDGIHETDDHKIYGQAFTLESMTENNTVSKTQSTSGKTGKLITHYFKNSDSDNK